MKLTAIRAILEWITGTMDGFDIPGPYDNLAHVIVDIILRLVPKEMTGAEKKAEAVRELTSVGVSPEKAPEVIQRGYDTIKKVAPELLEAGNGDTERERP